MVEHIVHIDGAPKPKHPQCGMKQGGGVLSKGASQAAAQRGDHCEVDRATGAALESSIRPSAVGEADRQTLGFVALRDHRFESCCDHHKPPEIRSFWGFLYAMLRQ